MGMRRLAARFAAGAAGFGLAQMFAVQAMAEAGRPVPGAMGLQEGVTELRHSAQFFHNAILLPMCIIISLFVLGLLLWCVVRYNKKSNPTPAKWSHNTLIEVIWTVVPVLILMFIAVFSFRLLISYHEYPKAADGKPGKPDITVKATGYQWQWGYEYPDQQIKEYIANVLPEDEVAKRGLSHDLYRLATTKPVVVPVNKTVRVLVTGADVIHAWGVPAFGVIIDAIPGRVNETWFRAEKEGVYYGNCRELCGIDHAFMPIEVHVVSQAKFDEWTVSQGGKTAAMVAADEAAAKAKAEADAAAAKTAAAAAPAADGAAVPAAATAPVSTQATPATTGSPAKPAATTAAPAAAAPAKK